RPCTDFVAYADRLLQFVHHSGTFMRPVYAAARKIPVARSRVIFAEGEEERVLRAAQVLIDEHISRPVLVGRPAIIEHRLQRYGLRIKPGVDFLIVNPEQDPRYREYWEDYRQLMA